MELTSHEATIEGVSSRGQELVTGGHFASDNIQTKRAELLGVWSSLTETTSHRSKMLNDSLDVQQVGVMY